PDLAGGPDPRHAGMAARTPRSAPRSRAGAHHAGRVRLLPRDDRVLAAPAGDGAGRLRALPGGILTPEGDPLYLGVLLLSDHGPWAVPAADLLGDDRLRVEASRRAGDRRGGCAASPPECALSLWERKEVQALLREIGRAGERP